MSEQVNEKGNQDTEIVIVMSPVGSFPVMTRVQAKAGLQPLPDLHSSLLQGGTKGPKKTRQQRRLFKYLGTPVSNISMEGLEVHGWQVPENIAVLQREDGTTRAQQGK